jgi:glycosyltransferase involved in cell wall biosynthesis
VEHPEIASCAIESLSGLTVPSGYSMEILPVEEADSTMDAYQFGMESSDAKLKLYMREYTVVLNTSLLEQLVRIFESNPNIGMIGMVGIKKLIPSTKICHGRWNNKNVAGKKTVIGASGDVRMDFPYQTDDLTYVEAAEDFLIATAVDLPWNTGCCKHAYHGCIEHALEMREKGYAVAVPFQDTPWCAVADMGAEVDTAVFEQEKQVFLRAHKELFPQVSVMIPTYNRTEWFKVCLDSVIAQTYPNTKIYVCDNGRDFITANMMKESYSSHSNIIYERNEENIGAYNNIRKLYSKMDTAFRTAVTDDSWFTPLCIERQMDYFCLDEEKNISIACGYSGLSDADGNSLGIFANLDKTFPEDTVAEGWQFANIMLKYNLTLFNVFSGVFRAERLTEPFGVMNGRDGLSNLDRYSAYVLLSSGLGVYCGETVSVGRVHSQQIQREWAVVLGGGNDYFHEVQSAKRYGFMADPSDFKAAVEGTINYYNRFVLNCECLGHLGREHQGELDICLENIRSVYSAQVTAT